jgi:hypothetical protein
MIYSLDTLSYVEDIPHRREYDIWRAQISEEEYSAIIEALNVRLDGGEIVTSSWVPGSDWSGTVYEPIYVKACRMDEDYAAKFFGLLMWVAVLSHEDVWSFGRYQQDGNPIEGMTYFRLPNPPLR